jgi:CheY-like chemotaxis protein
MSAKRKILVVEDEAIVAMHLSELLQSKGYDVVGIASDANAALEKYASHQPDVILIYHKRQKRRSRTGKRDFSEKSGAGRIPDCSC